MSETMVFDEHDLPGELVDDDEQQLINALFGKPFPDLDKVKQDILSGKFTFQQLQNMYAESLSGWIDVKADHLLRIILDGAYLADLWSKTAQVGYTKWFHVYLSNRSRLNQIISYYKVADDFKLDFVKSAAELKSELYLLQTQPGEPEDLDVDHYLDEYDFGFENKLTMSGNANSSVITASDLVLKKAFTPYFNADFLKTSAKPAVREMPLQYKPPIKRPPLQIHFYEAPVEPEKKSEPIIFRDYAKRKHVPDSRYSIEKYPDASAPSFEITYTPSYTLPNPRFDKGEDDPFVYISVPVPKALNNDNFERVPEYEEIINFDDRGVSSSALEIAEECELKPVEYQHLRFSDVGKMVRTVRDIAYRFKRRNATLRANWRKIGVFPDPPKYRYCLDPKLLKEYGLKKKPLYLDEFMLEDELKKHIPTVIKTLTNKLNDMLKDGVSRQDVALLLMDGVYIDFLAENIIIPSSGETLAEFIEYAGDEILDFAENIQNPPGWHQAEDSYYYHLIENLDFFSQVPYSEDTVEHSKLFNDVVLEHITNSESVSKAYAQAYHAVKMNQSPLGAYAYDLARFFGKSHNQAMHEFYQVAQEVGDMKPLRDKIVEVHPDHLVVMTAISKYDKRREINANITAIKVRNSELFVPANANMNLKSRLMQFLSPLQLPTKLLSTLKE